MPTRFTLAHPLLSLLAVLTVELGPGQVVRARAAEPASGGEAALPIPDDLMPEERRFIEIFRKASGSVVYITTSQVQRDLFSLDAYAVPQGSGTGFVWDKAGHIVTNYHVVKDGDSFEVTLGDHTTFPAQLIGAAPDKDLAVLQVKVTPERLTPLETGHSHDLLVGQRVLAVGNPFGLDHSLSVGVVSALGRELKSPGGRTIRDVIQTDAAINPGNSGGPLLDSRGRVVGVNSAIYSPSGAFAGIGFSIPVDTVRRLVPQLIAKGGPVQVGIGMSLLSDSFAARLGVDGAIIYEVGRGSAAAKAGLVGLHRVRRSLELGDRILQVNGKPVKGSDALLDAFENAGPGQSVVLTVKRGGAEREVKVTLQEE